MELSRVSEAWLVYEALDGFCWPTGMYGTSFIIIFIIIIVIVIVFILLFLNSGNPLEVISNIWIGASTGYSQ